MKALTLHQPWAALVAAGVKRIETRGWPCAADVVGGWLAIHAGKRPMDGDAAELWQGQGDYARAAAGPLEYGAVVAVCFVRCCHRVEDLRREKKPGSLYMCGAGGCGHDGWTAVESDHLGDFSPGRWLWFLEDVQRLAPAEPARGYMGLWKWERGPV